MFIFPLILTYSFINYSGELQYANGLETQPTQPQNMHALKLASQSS